MFCVHRQHAGSDSQNDLVRASPRHPDNASQPNKKFICPFTVFDEVIGQSFDGFDVKSHSNQPPVSWMHNHSRP